MSEEKTRSDEGCAPAPTDDVAPEPAAVDVVELGRASQRTRGQLTGFVTEPSAFPLREL